MIKGDRASGHFVTYDGSGVKIEGETRQCGHCQFVWEYRPGSGRRFGLCQECHCMTCARPECRADQLQKLAIIQFEDGQRYDCVPYFEWNYRLMEKAGRTPGKIGRDFIMSEAGLIIPHP